MYSGGHVTFFSVHIHLNQFLLLQTKHGKTPLDVLECVTTPSELLFQRIVSDFVDRSPGP